jgi:DNA-binding winged helix-turn-helix (wHTH) protein
MAALSRQAPWRQSKTRSRTGCRSARSIFLVGERLLTKDGAPVELGARAFDILLVLLSTPNETVSKKDLMSRVWPDVTR